MKLIKIQSNFKQGWSSIKSYTPTANQNQTLCPDSIDSFLEEDTGATGVEVNR